MLALGLRFDHPPSLLRPEQASGAAAMAPFLVLLLGAAALRTRPACCTRGPEVGQGIFLHEQRWLPNLASNVLLKGLS